MLRFSKNKKALSLVEILVVLVIISTTVLTALSLILHSTIDIKENEVKDTVNGLLVNINEAMKSPAQVQIKDFTPGSFAINNYYAFKVEPQGTGYVLTWVAASPTLSDCPSNSQFKYNITVSQTTLRDVCILVSIRRTSGTRFIIQTNSMYTLLTGSGETVYSYLSTNRYDDFEYI